MGPSAGGEKLPRYGMINLARDRGRGVRFTLHAEGRVTKRVINHARTSRALRQRLRGRDRGLAVRHSERQVATAERARRRPRCSVSNYSALKSPTRDPAP